MVGQDFDGSPLGAGEEPITPRGGGWLLDSVPGRIRQQGHIGCVWIKREGPSKFDPRWKKEHGSNMH